MRNRYVDLLRAVAIVRVVTYHTLGFAWLTVAFPAMGLMFALGGSLMAASLDRDRERARIDSAGAGSGAGFGTGFGTGFGSGLKAIGRRMRRIVVPFWVLGAFAVVLMSFMGGLEHTWRLVLWFLPLDDPPTSEKGGIWFSQIWYVRSYLWFIILSPVMLWLFRRAPIPTVLVPFGILVALWETGHGTGGMVRDFFMYAPMWMLGFAHHDGTLQRISKKVLWPACLLVGGIGLAMLYSHPGPRGYDMNDLPVADVLWSTAFLLVMLHAAPAALSLGAAEPGVEAINRRALTIYLWHEAVITAVRFGAVAAGVSLLGPYGGMLQIVLVFALVTLVVLALGWVEDLAARRRPKLVPLPARAPVGRREEQRQPVPA